MDAALEVSPSPASDDHTEMRDNLVAGEAVVTAAEHSDLGNYFSNQMSFSGTPSRNVTTFPAPWLLLHNA